MTSLPPVSRPASPTSRISVSSIRPVKSPITARKQVAVGADVLPPWKQGDYVVAEGGYTTMTTMTCRTITQLGQEQRQEQQVIGIREVRDGPRGAGVQTTMWGSTGPQGNLTNMAGDEVWSNLRQ